MSEELKLFLMNKYLLDNKPNEQGYIFFRCELIGLVKNIEEFFDSYLGSLDPDQEIPF